MGNNIAKQIGCCCFVPCQAFVRRRIRTGDRNNRQAAGDTGCADGAHLICQGCGAWQHLHFACHDQHSQDLLPHLGSLDHLGTLHRPPWICAVHQTLWIGAVGRSATCHAHVPAIATQTVECLPCGQSNVWLCMSWWPLHNIMHCTCSASHAPLQHTCSCHEHSAWQLQNTKEICSI